MKNLMKQKLQRKEMVFGTFFTMGNISAMECLGYTGLDFVVIDTEHGAFDTETAMHLVCAAENVDLTPIIRIADVTHKEIQRAVDIGARGLVVPCLCTMDEIKKLIDFAKFAPIGNRGFIKGRASGFGYQQWALDIDNFMAVSNEKLMLLPQCETVECLEMIEDVVALEGIDGIFIGPFDLSIAMGIPTQFHDERFQKAIKRILYACKHVGKPTFIFTATMEDAKKYKEMGFEGIAHNIDSNVLINAYKAMVDEWKQM